MSAKETEMRAGFAEIRPLIHDAATDERQYQVRAVRCVKEQPIPGVLAHVDAERGECHGVSFLAAREERAVSWPLSPGFVGDERAACAVSPRLPFGLAPFAYFLSLVIPYMGSLAAFSEQRRIRSLQCSLDCILAQSRPRVLGVGCKYSTFVFPCRSAIWSRACNIFRRRHIIVARRVTGGDTRYPSNSAEGSRKMTLSFPNPSQRYDAVRRRVCFWGYEAPWRSRSSWRKASSSASIRRPRMSKGRCWRPLIIPRSHRCGRREKSIRSKSAVFTFWSPATFDGHGGKLGNKWRWRDNGPAWEPGLPCGAQGSAAGLT